MPEISHVSLTDYAALSTFLADFPGDESGSADSWLRRMHTWWDLNPAFDEDFARGWLLREQGKIVGFLGSIPWKFQLGGRETTVFAGTTWRVLPEYRGMSIALKRRQMEEHGDVLHFSTTPRAEVERLLTSCSATRRCAAGKATNRTAPSSWTSRSWCGPSSMAGPRPGPWRRAPRRPLDAIQKLRMRRLSAAARTRKSAKLHQADAAFDDLWERTRSRYPSTHVRTAEAINWYCFSSPDFEKTLLGYFDGERLAGYIVFLSTERRGVRFFECVDLWIESGPRREVILGALIEKARRCAEEASFDRMLPAALRPYDRRDLSTGWDCCRGAAREGPVSTWARANSCSR